VTTATGATTYTENAASTPIDPGLTVTDVDGGTLSGAVVQVTAGFVPAEDVLGFGALPGGVTADTSVPGTITFTGAASLASYQNLLRSVTFRNTSDNPAAGDRTVSFTATDAPSSGPPL